MSDETPEDIDELDRIFGVGEWVKHIGCPAALDAGMPYAYHHRDSHRDYQEPS